MQITSTLSFTAAPNRVADMLTNPKFADHVGAEIKADNVTTTNLDDGMTSVFTMISPEAARKILGPTMTITETVTWQPASPNGARTGRLTLSVAGVPATSDGPLRLGPTPSGSQMIYDADFSVKIPLFGKKIEKMAEQYLSNVIKACEKVGNEWLTSNP
ncbi:MAG: DUF2505 domain-containing protein [Propionibacteriaceae bacterium]|jgi:hypothetical protein|nr:DUF2505 domain-containing protein [Propionibacteriaceae bacterium]